MNVMITGAAGFIGSHLCESLLERGDRVTGIDNFDPFYDHGMKEKNLSGFIRNENFRFFQNDIREPDELKKVWEKNCRDLDAVVHLAARAGVKPSIADPAGYEKTNVAGTLNLLELAVVSDPCPKFIFGSSSSVYGNDTPLPFSESDKTESPVSPYAATKKACELLCHTYSHLYGMDMTMLRLFTVYGPRQRPDLAIHKFSRAILDGKPIEMYGDGSSCRDYTHVSDTIAGITAAIDHCKGYEIYNLGRSDAIVLKDMITAIEKVSGKKADVIQCDPFAGDVKKTCADISKARLQLGYHPKKEFMEGLREFLDWLKRN